MGKASNRKAALRATKFVARVRYSDGSEDLTGFATREEALRLARAVQPMLAEPEGVDLVEVIERESGAVEFRSVREVRL
jgi:hypothetical protein